MQQLVRYGMFIGLMCVGVLSDGLLGKSYGQVCPVNQGCGNTIGTGAHYGTVGGGTGHNVNGYGGTVGGGFSNAAIAAYDTVSGGRENTASGGASTVGGGSGNDATDIYATVSGGLTNTSTQAYATIGGGRGNIASGDFATIGGGYQNQASGFYATVSGGNLNQATGERSSVGGGHGNRANGSRATVSGGVYNTASGYGSMAPGGFNNIASGNFSFAAGRQARALHNGAFVWADTVASPFPSTAFNQFNIRASGGTRIFTNGAATVGVQLSPGSNAWSIASDRALKEDFQPIDKQQILAGVQRLSIQNWKLKDEKGNVRHIGPVAQDFHTTFGLGSDERYLHSGDVDGIALAAIQALADQVQALREQNQALATRLAAMEQK